MKRRTLFLCGFTNDKILNFDFDDNAQHVNTNIDNDDVVGVDDDSSKTCSISDGLLVTNNDRLFHQAEEVTAYNNNDGIYQWT